VILVSIEQEAVQAIPTSSCAVQGALADALVAGLVRVLGVEPPDLVTCHPAGSFAHKVRSYVESRVPLPEVHP
jgi:hypothetical protein